MTLKSVGGHGVQAAPAHTNDGSPQSVVDLRRLEYFLAIVDHGGMGKASNQIHVAQPSLSQAVHVLERELGAALFEKVGRGIALTTAGRALVEPARKALEDTSKALEAVQSVTRSTSGWIDIASYPMLAMDPIPRLVGGFRQAYPGVGLNIIGTADSVSDVNNLVSGGSCEIGMTYVTSRDPELEYWSLGHQQFSVIVPPGLDHGWGGARALSHAELAALPWVLGPPGSAVRDLLDKDLELSDMGIHVVVESNDSESLVPLVLAGAGATLLPASVAEVARRRSAARYEITPPLTREVALVHGRYGLSSLARSFKEWVLTHGMTLMTDGELPLVPEVVVA